MTRDREYREKQREIEKAMHPGKRDTERNIKGPNDGRTQTQKQTSMRTDRGK